VTKRPPRVLHVVESLGHGAVENWLLRMLEHARESGIQLDWTFYTQLTEAGVSDSSAEILGAKVVHSPVSILNTAVFMASLRSELSRHPYDVLHCHHDLVSAIYLVAASGLGIRRKIVHIHNADEHIPTSSSTKASFLRTPMRRVCLSADRVVGISSHVLDTFLAGRPRHPKRDLVHYYGVDANKFSGCNLDSVEFRRNLCLPENSLILLFGGRIVPEKNPVFAVDVLSALRRLTSRAVLVYAGNGSLCQAVLDRASALGVRDHVLMLGWRNDLPSIMSCSDLFILPRPERPMEGFGLAVVEAQLAGLHLLISCGIADDPLLPGASFRRLSLDSSPSVWAEAALCMLQAAKPCPKAARQALNSSKMNMDSALQDLLSLHA